MNKYFSLVLFAHTVFAMPFAIIGFFLAVTTTTHEFNWLKLFLMLLCMVFARNAAMAFNRYLDRDIDAQNPRTSVRDIPSGRISSKEALLFTIGNSLLFIHFTDKQTLFLPVSHCTCSCIGLQFYQKIYSALPPHLRPWTCTSANRSLFSCYR